MTVQKRPEYSVIKSKTYVSTLKINTKIYGKPLVFEKAAISYQRPNRRLKELQNYLPIMSLKG